MALRTRDDLPSLPKGYKVKRFKEGPSARDPLAQRVTYVVSGHGQHEEFEMDEGAEPSLVRDQIFRTLAVLMKQRLEAQKSETRLYGEAIGADAVITGEGEEYIENRTYGTSLTQQMREAMDKVAMQMMEDRGRETVKFHRSARLAETVRTNHIIEGYKAAAECDYLTTLEVDDRGVIIVMKDGEDYTTSMVAWGVLATWPTGLLNPIIELIQALARQRQEGMW